MPSCLHQGRTRSIPFGKLRVKISAGVSRPLVPQVWSVATLTKCIGGEADVRAEPPAERQKNLKVKHAV